MELLERDELLAVLQAHLKLASAGPGILAFVEGEAGIGKTALLKTFADRQRDSLPVRWGVCDALQTPRPLGPLHDISAQVGGELRVALEGGTDRLHIFGTFLGLLSSQPALVLLEDLHWADEATLDLLRYVGRRMAGTRSLLVGSFRNDEVGPAHPLRLVLGDLATSGIERLVPRPLSLQAVHELAGERELDVAELHQRTGGNPFFVTEVLAAGGEGVPATVRDAVLARAARLRRSARAILDAAAVAGPRVEPWLLQELVAAESSAVEECLATGVLRVGGRNLRFSARAGAPGGAGGACTHPTARPAPDGAAGPAVARRAGRRPGPFRPPRGGCGTGGGGAGVRARRGARGSGPRCAPAGGAATGACLAPDGAEFHPPSGAAR
jgi:predicted ATPase